MFKPLYRPCQNKKQKNTNTNLPTFKAPNSAAHTNTRQGAPSGTRQSSLKFVQTNKYKGEPRAQISQQKSKDGSPRGRVEEAEDGERRQPSGMERISGISWRSLGGTPSLFASAASPALHLTSFSTSGQSRTPPKGAKETKPLRTSANNGRNFPHSFSPFRRPFPRS